MKTTSIIKSKPLPKYFLGGEQGDDALKYGSKGVALGSTLGSVIPGVGTVAGGVIGGVGGALYGAFGNHGDAIPQQAKPITPYQGTLTPTFACGGKYPYGGYANAQIEKQEVVEDPSGQMMQVDGPTHAEGGVNVNLEPGTKIFSDRLKSANGKTFAENTGKLMNQKNRFIKKLEDNKSTLIQKNTAKLMLRNTESKIQGQFEEQESQKDQLLQQDMETFAKGGIVKRNPEHIGSAIIRAFRHYPKGTFIDNNKRTKNIQKFPGGGELDPNWNPAFSQTYANDPIRYQQWYNAFDKAAPGNSQVIADPFFATLGSYGAPQDNYNRGNYYVTPDSVMTPTKDELVGMTPRQYQQNDMGIQSNQATIQQRPSSGYQYMTAQPWMSQANQNAEYRKSPDGTWQKSLALGKDGKQSWTNVDKQFSPRLDESLNPIQPMGINNIANAEKGIQGSYSPQRKDESIQTDSLSNKIVADNRTEKQPWLTEDNAFKYSQFVNPALNIARGLFDKPKYYNASDYYINPNNKINKANINPYLQDLRGQRNVAMKNIKRMGAQQSLAGASSLSNAYGKGVGEAYGKKYANESAQVEANKGRQLQADQYNAQVRQGVDQLNRQVYQGKERLLWDNGIGMIPKGYQDYYVTKTMGNNIGQLFPNMKRGADGKWYWDGSGYNEKPEK